MDNFGGRVAPCLCPRDIWTWLVRDPSDALLPGHLRDPRSVPKTDKVTPRTRRTRLAHVSATIPDALSVDAPEHRGPAMLMTSLNFRWS